MNATFGAGILALGLLAAAGPLGAQEVRMRPAQSPDDRSHGYFIGLARLALEKTEADSGPAPIRLSPVADFSQERALKDLAAGISLDLDWAGTNFQREKDLLPVRIPLTGGLLGYRVPVIRKASVPVFDKVRTLEDLKKLTAVQGDSWPDSDILEAAGLKVERVPLFETMYDMLRAGRADYFPRGLNEVYAEVKADPTGTLVAYDGLIIAYRFPMYFFTSRNNPALARRIETGLRRAIADGSFLKYMKSSPVLADVFPLSRFKDSRILSLPNPYLPPETPLNDQKLWLKLGF